MVVLRTFPKFGKIKPDESVNRSFAIFTSMSEGMFASPKKHKKLTSII